eukprot:GFUD01003478.1.p1 GENE.GFUD01003478.1~~GFUD01003478.1.p1  ORF type:complete len:172 (-),score=25.48 GFUD01003478.1:200-715(-)
MKLIFLIFLGVLVSIASCTPQFRPPRPPRPDELASSHQSKGGNNRPPPPPGAGQVNAIRESAAGAGSGSLVPAKSNTRWIWDDNCKNDRPPFELGRWIQVRYNDCIIAFEDPDFDFHENFCGNPNVNPTHTYLDWYGPKTEAMWTYPEYKYCGHVPVCLACPALGRCGPRG